jgi:uncharacterized protein (TIGR00255 family)
MLFSMTGFSSDHVDIKLSKDRKISLVIELKSLNARFFESSIRLPNTLSFIETDLISRLKSKLIRGRTFLTIYPVRSGQGFEDVVPSLQAAQSYAKAIESIKKELNITGTLTVSDLVILPNIFASEKATIGEDAKKNIFQAVDAVADILMKRRRTEGKDLEKDLKNHFDSCERHIKTIKTIADKLMKDQKKKVATIQALSQDGDALAATQLEDLYTTLNKIDINEEITRFKSHLSSAREIIANANKDKGKRLDFTLQELLRETNTIASKCLNFKISTAAVDIKVDLEKAREQTQNIL